MLKKEKIKIEGIHCESCKTLIETELDVLVGVLRVDVNYLNGDAELEYDDEKIKPEKIFSELERLNYKVKEIKNDKNILANPFWAGLTVPVGLILVVFIIWFFKDLGGLEIMAKLNETDVSLWLVFTIGVLASFHCVGMCGGLVVAYSANELKEKKRKNIFKPHFQYNFGRLISYTVIGGILGGVGSFFAINPSFTGTLTLFVGAFMILMGVSFLSGGRILEKIKIKTPQSIARFLYDQKRSKNPKGPFIIGLLNGFMPCGPLQAMQLFALGTGSLLAGASAMFVYALGTIPLMFGFGVILSKIGGSYVKNVMKISGVLIIILGIFMGIRGINNFGIGFSSNNADILIDSQADLQEVRMELTYLGYQPNIIYIKKGIPVRWIVDVKEMTGCTNAIMIESLGIEKDLVKGENIIEFTPPENVSEIKFSCWMKMVWGKFIILEDGQKTSEVKAAEPELPQTGCGGGCGADTCAAAQDLPCGCGANK